MENNKLIHSNNVKITPGKLIEVAIELVSEVQLSLTANRAEEKSPFLQDERNKPVSLTPAWEAGNKPNEELNFKGKSFI